MKTIITVEIDHAKALPEDLLSKLECKAYDYLRAKDVPSEVMARVWTHIALPVKEMGNGAA